MPLSGVDLALWAAGLVGHAMLLAVLLGRRRAVRFPWFTALIGVNLGRTATLFTLLGHPHAYAAVYVAAGFLDVFLQFGVVVEVAWHVFRPLGHWAPDARRGMWGLVLASLAVASGLTWLAAGPANGFKGLLFVKANFFTSVLFSELFLGMVILSVTVGLPWRTHVARIAQGLGVFSILEIALEAAHTMYGSVQHGGITDALTLARKLLYLMCVAYWIVTLWEDAPEPRELSAHARAQLRGLQARVAYDLGTIRHWRKP